MSSRDVQVVWWGSGDLPMRMRLSGIPPLPMKVIPFIGVIRLGALLLYQSPTQNLGDFCTMHRRPEGLATFGDWEAPTTVDHVGTYYFPGCPPQLDNILDWTLDLLLFYKMKGTLVM